MKKFTKILVSAITASSLIVSPVFAEPNSVDNLETQKKEAQQEVDTLQADLTKILTKINDIDAQMTTKGGGDHSGEVRFRDCTGKRKEAVCRDEISN
ncbi:MAG: hypothetical protein ACLRVG_02175 [Coprococcus phoceensis]